MRRKPIEHNTEIRLRFLFAHGVRHIIGDQVRAELQRLYGPAQGWRSPWQSRIDGFVCAWLRGELTSEEASAGLRVLQKDLDEQPHKQLMVEDRETIRAMIEALAKMVAQHNAYLLTHEAYDANPDWNSPFRETLYPKLPEALAPEGSEPRTDFPPPDVDLKLR